MQTLSVVLCRRQFPHCGLGLSFNSSLDVKGEAVGDQSSDFNPVSDKVLHGIKVTVGGLEVHPAYPAIRNGLSTPLTGRVCRIQRDPTTAYVNWDLTKGVDLCMIRSDTRTVDQVAPNIDTVILASRRTIVPDPQLTIIGNREGADTLPRTCATTCDCTRHFHIHCVSTDPHVFTSRTFYTVKSTRSTLISVVRRRRQRPSRRRGKS